MSAMPGAAADRRRWRPPPLIADARLRWGLALAALAYLVVGINEKEALGRIEREMDIGYVQLGLICAIVLFGVFGLVAFGVGWFLAGDTFKAWFARARSRS